MNSLLKNDTNSKYSITIESVRLAINLWVIKKVYS
jgi:hypothetical protein